MRSRPAVIWLDWAGRLLQLCVLVNERGIDDTMAHTMAGCLPQVRAHVLLQWDMHAVCSVCGSSRYCLVADGLCGRLSLQTAD